MKEQQFNKIKRLDLEAVDAKLREIAENGSFDEAVDESLVKHLRETEPSEISASEFNQFLKTVKKASVENMILKVRTEIPYKKLPLGRFIQLIRDRCDLTKTDIAKVLDKDLTYIDKIESGQTSPLHLEARDIADIMQLFRITVTELKNCIESFLSILDSKRYKANAMARSSIKAGEKGKDESLGLAMDAALQAIADKKGKSSHVPPVVSPDYISTIMEILIERGEKGLLI
jgi:transcriptional regulator with XRE-family HTH domain